MASDEKRIRFGVTIGNRHPQEIVELGELADNLGFDSVWICDHLVDMPMPEAIVTDPWTILGALGGRTERALLSQLTTDCIRVHPAKTAHMIAALDELTGGRAALGIGSGEVMNVVPFGMPFGSVKERVQRLREAVQIIKLLWSSSVDTPVSFEGQFYQLDRARLDEHPVQKPHPPIYLGALGSKASLELAGELGDGWIPWTMSKELYAESVQVIKSSAERVGRNISDIDRGIVTYIASTEDPEVLARIKNTLKANLVWHRYDLKTLGKIPLPLDYTYQRLRATREEAQAILEAAKQIPDELIERDFIATRSIDNIIDFIDGYIKAGATHIIILDAEIKGDSTATTLKRVREKIIPYFKGQ